MDETELKDRVAHVSRSPVLKTLIVGSSERSRAETKSLDEETTRRFGEAGALVPPYSPQTLCEIFEASSALRQNVDAYATNIDGNGHHLEPILDLDADDLVEQVANAIYIERLAARERGQVVEKIVPDLQEVEERLSIVEDAMRVERFKIEQFFETCTIEESFVSLRKKTRQDLEITGNGYWEVLRDNHGAVAQFVYLSAQNIRLLAQGREFVEVVVPTRVSPLSVVPEKLRRRFRRFVQVVDQHRVFFKELGDPRCCSSKTGKYYASIDELRSAEGRDVEPATEVLHFRIHSSTSAYGVPRWIGSLLGVLGNRNAEEVNLLYFENKSVPPMALLVSGGRVTKDTVDSLSDFIDNEIKGKRNFHKILVIEAEPSGADSSDGLATGRMKIELKPLTQAQQSDALFQKYDERNADKIGMNFRLPRLLRGDVRDFNRGTADAALEFAETQVFGPERTEFDFQINRAVLASLGVRFHTFHSNAVRVQDPRTLAEIIAKLTTANVLVPNDARTLVEDLVFNRKLAKIDGDWVYQPVMLSQVGVPLDGTRDGSIPGLDESTAPSGPGSSDGEGGGGPTPPQSKIAAAWRRMTGGRARRKKDLIDIARTLLAVRDEMRKLEDDEAIQAHKDAAADLAREEGAPGGDLEEERITMPLDQMIKRFKIKPAA